MHSTTLFASAAAAALFSLAHAHGIVHEIVVEGGKTLTSPLIGSNADAGNFWLVSDNSPVHGFDTDELLCGRVAKKGSATPEVAAGSTLTFNWNSGYSNTQSSWPHNTGPMFFYMAKCDGSCSSVSSSTKWTKMAQFGIENGAWRQADLQKSKGIPFTIPKDLEEGEYVIRHEVINLAIAEPEMFPQCSNFKVTGGGSTSLSSEKQVTFPGAYKASDSGLISGAPIYEIRTAAAYTFPGPALFGESGSGGEDAPAPSPSKSKDAPTTSSVKDGAPASTKSADAPASSSKSGAAPKPTTTTDAAPVNNGAAGSSSAASTSFSSAADDDAAPSSAESAPPAPSSNADPAAAATCATAWTECNSKYKGLEEDQKNYRCQTDFNDCVAKTMASTANTNAKRMHRRRALFHNAAAQFSH